MTAAPFFRFFRDGVLISGAFESGIAFTTGAQADGTFSYTLAAVDAAGNASAPPAGLSVTLDTAAPAASAAADLQAGSDSGQSDSDNNTSDNTPTFDVSASPFFRVFRDGVLISGAFENGATFTTGVQADGTFAYTLAAVDAAGNESTPSAGLSVTIDTVAPSAPAAPDLQAGSDSGQSSNDNNTSDNTPTFDVSAAPLLPLLPRRRVDQSARSRAVPPSRRRCRLTGRSPTPSQPWTPRATHPLPRQA